MTINATRDTSFDLDSNSSDCDSGHLSFDDFPLTSDEIQEIYDELDLDEEEITEDEVTRRKRRIFVGGLKFASEDCVLHDYFSQFGKIKEAVVIKDRKTGLSKGYGFVTMFEDLAALRAVIDKGPKLDGRRCNVNLAYIGQKRKPPSKKPDLKLRDLAPISPMFNYNANGYLVSPTVITPTGQYYQLGLPPLHGHQPIYHIPSSPPNMYEADTYASSLPPPSPMSPCYQQPIYYTHPVIISNHPQANMPYQPPNAIYQQAAPGAPNDFDNNNNNNNNDLPLDANKNVIHQNNSATTTVVPSTYGHGTSHQQQPSPYLPCIPVSSSTAGNLPGTVTTYTQGVSTETRPLVVNGKPNTSNNLTMTPVHHGGHPQVVHNGPGPMSAVTTNLAAINNGSGVVTHPAGNVHYMNGGAILHAGHPHMVGVPSHNVAVTSFVTSPLPSPAMQSPNQTQIFQMHPANAHHQGAYFQPREVVPI